MQTNFYVNDSLPYVTAAHNDFNYVLWKLGNSLRSIILHKKISEVKYSLHLNIVALYFLVLNIFTKMSVFQSVNEVSSVFNISLWYKLRIAVNQYFFFQIFNKVAFLRMSSHSYQTSGKYILNIRAHFNESYHSFLLLLSFILFIYLFIYLLLK